LLVTYWLGVIFYFSNLLFPRVVSCIHLYWIASSFFRTFFQ